MCLASGEWTAKGLAIMTKYTPVSGIYVILNTKNGKVYIGQTKDFLTRKHHHTYQLTSNCHSNKHLQAAWNKYGEKSFKFKILEYCSLELLDEREQHHLTIYLQKDMCYNIAKDVRSPNRGQVVSDETKRKMSIAMKGKQVSSETRRKISQTLTGRPGIKGVKHTPESIQKMKDYHKNKPPASEETRRKISESNKGRVVSEETRRKIGESNSGKIRTEETKKKLSEARKRRPPPSEETRRKISEASKGKTHTVSEATKEKLRIAAKEQWERKKEKTDD